MSNGYGYKNAVSPAATAGYGGYGYGNPTPYPGMASAPGLGSSMNPASMMPMSGMPASMMPMSGMPASMMPMSGMPTSTVPQTAVAGLQTQPPVGVPSGSVIMPGGGGNLVASPVVEESYIENILRLNRGKIGTFYMTYENNKDWNAKIFKGVIEAAGRDHIIISDPATGMRFLLLTLNLDYVTFDGPINYEYPFQGGSISSTTPIATTLPANTTAVPGSTGR